MAVAQTGNDIQQYLRKYRLIVYDKKNADNSKGLDLSQLRIKFDVKRSSAMTPNVADIIVYNMDTNTANKIGIGGNSQFNAIILEAGYEGNYGTIFEGNIKQIIQGRESATDTFVEFICGDGDRAFNYAVVSTSLVAGATAEQQVVAAMKPMKDKGVTPGHMGEFPKTKLPRAKAIFGMSRDVLRMVSQSTNRSWSIQDGKVTFIENTTYLPGQVIKLTSDTGMIGTPQQTTLGVNAKCLLNPTIKVGGRIQLDNKSIQKFKIDFTVPGSPGNTPTLLSADGVYFAFCVEHQGDTRGTGTDWYTSLVLISIAVGTNPRNAIAQGTS